jgi:hypothetical protein
MKIFVTPDEFTKLKDIELDCYDWNGKWNDWQWYGKVKALLGCRCPEPYSGPHDILVDWPK